MALAVGRGAWPAQAESISTCGRKCPRRASRSRRQCGDRGPRPRLRGTSRRLCRTQPDVTIEETAMREYLKNKVSRFEQPRDIKFVERIPRNPAGRVLRKELPA